MAQLQGDHERAVRLWGAAEALREKIGLLPAGVEQAPSERAVATARSALGEEKYAAARAEVRTMSPERAVGGKGGKRQMSGLSSDHADLTAREVEVLRLVAAGLSDAQVAKKLFISRRMVNAHLRLIYSKLGASSRGMAVRFARDHGFV